MSAPAPLAGVSLQDTAACIPQAQAAAGLPQTPSQNRTQTQSQTQPGPQAPKTTLQQLQQLLPTCQRCRRLRRKCDTQLPNCRPCHRAGVECSIFDHALKQTLPRAYVQSLLTRVEHLEAVKASGGRVVQRDDRVPGSVTGTAVTAATSTIPANISTEQTQTSAAPPSLTTTETATTTATTPSSATTLAQPQDAPGPTTSSPTPSSHTPSYDLVVPSTVSVGKSRYWGASSVFALMVEILQHATARAYVSLEDIGAGSNAPEHGSADPGSRPGRGGAFGDVPGMDHDEQQAAALHHHHYNANNLVGDNSASAAAEADIRALLRLYLASSNTLYGFVDPEHAFADLEVYLTIRRQRQGGSYGNNNTTTPNSAFGSMTSPPAGQGTGQGQGQGQGVGTGNTGSVPSPTTTFGLGGGTGGTGGPAALGDQAHSYFRIAMMCAIACATKARYRPQRTAESLAYYADALAYVEDVTAEVSPASLQALLLLIVFCLFFPRKGDVWKLLDYACRLALELGYHTEMDEGGGATAAAEAGIPGAGPTRAAPSGESEAEKKLRRSTFWGLYAIERIVGQLFGRGSDLPESIITVSYPSALVPVDAVEAADASSSTTTATATATATSPAVPRAVDRSSMQAMIIAHHYRLVYLRSEIFRTLYLPARPCPGGDSASANRMEAPDCQLDWLRRQYQTLHAWRQELAVPAGDEREGVATLTCDVGYDATMCFLFQPLLLRALREGPDSPSLPPSSSSSSPLLPVASDAFYSSIRLIRTYEKIIRAPESSELGSYPITFMSAHYIYLASSTLLANALLRLDGRVTVLPPMGEDAVNSGSVGSAELDWGAYVDMSSSCLILLAWCGERWPGMLGMLGVYQRLFGRTIRELIGKGIVR
ncbi:c6 transcription factor [Ophiostoma piceae UAMH 11346]|uniref:C6 transcription factor n=1 Tax=Ophiostoma piceae (strain UAMH 11346) TaxID=1262450 RepID=S3C900_OPHP1|nr:c6 transcription factor [Ophiostoma piceae UAMH 11346]